MIPYCDSSALAKRYITEPGSDRLDEVLGRSSVILTSALTELELVAFFERAKRTGQIDSPTYRHVTALLDREVRDGLITLLEIAPSTLQTAKRLIRLRRLRPPDAIQLGTAMGLRERVGDEAQFFCSDRTLLEAARLEGLRCLDPAST